VTPTDIAVKYLNFFIVTDAKTENRKEVHLAGYAPTDKSIQDYFGGGPNNNPSNNDLSLNGVYYRGTDNLIWGLIIPGTFNYPKENESILNAYPKFKDWATSGGVNSQDWYSNSNGNTTYIYTINP
jgi:LruC domain-containing protein